MNSSQTLATGASVATFGIVDNTTYYFKVKVAAEPDSGYSAVISTINPIGTPTALIFDEVSTNSIVASAYAPTPSFSNLDKGLSGINVARDGTYAGYRIGNVWASKTAMPTARGNLAVGVVAGKLYAVGGTNGSNLGTNQEYDPVANTWTTKTAMPTARAYTSAGVIGGKLYAVGGNNGADLTTNEEYDPVGNAWTAKTGLPAARRSLAADVFAGKLYVVGGYAGSTYFAANTEYNPLTDAWVTKAAMPTARYSPGVGVVSGKLFVAGGYNAGFLTTHEEYDLVADTWATRTAMPTVRHAMPSVVVGGKIYVVGGNDGVSNLSANEEYDPASGVWAVRAAMPTGRGYAAGAAISGKVYVVGGHNGSYVGTLEEYDPGVSQKFTGLTPNTLYSFKARARNSVGVQTGESITVSTYTLAAPPSNLAATMVGSSSATLTWGANGNPAGTVWQVHRSTGADFVQIYSSSASPGYMDTGLSAQSTYYYQARALNGNLLATAFTSSITVVTGAIGTAPIAASGLTRQGLTSSSIEWRWTDNSSNENGFRVMSGTISLSGDLSPNTSTWNQTGLATNTQHGPYFVQAFNGTGASDSAAVSRYTATLIPAAFAATVHITSATLSWTANGNPDPTTYDVYRSTFYPAATLISSSTALTFINTGLSPLTTYFYRVQARNGDATYAAATADISFQTPPSPLAPLTPTYPANGSFVNVQPDFYWNGPSTATLSAYPAGTSYVLQVSHNDAGFSPANIVVSISTPAVVSSTNLPVTFGAYRSTFTLATDPHYWRVALSTGPGSLGPWSAANSFVADFLAPSPLAFGTLSSTGALLGQSERNPLLAGVTAQLNFQDVPSGLAVSTGSLAFAGDGHEGPDFSGGFGVMYSTNAGQSWIDYSTAAAVNGGAAVGASLYSLATFSGKLYADSTAGKVYSSADGVNWTAANGGGTIGADLRPLVAFNGKLYAGDFSNGKVYSSADGNSWSATNGGAAVGTSIRSMAEFNGKLYAGDNATARIYATADGTAWSAAQGGTAVGISGIEALAVFNGRLFAGDSTGKVYVSVDGSSWTSAGTPPGGSNIALFAIYNGRLYAGDGSASGKVWSTVDGNLWTAANGGTAVGNGLQAMSALNGKLYAVDGGGGAGKLYVSADGTTWLSPGNGATLGTAFYGLAPFNGKLYMGDNGSGKMIEVTPVSAALTGADGATTAQTLSAKGLNLALSTNTATCVGGVACAATNQILFTASDRAGNVAQAGPYAVITGPTPPAAPAGLTHAAVTANTIRWSWVDPSTNEDGFRVMAGTANISGDLAANTTTWLETGLSTNTAHGPRVVRAFNAGGTGDSGQDSGFSLTDPPNSISVTLFGSSVALTWPTMTNPAGTRWSVERGSDGVNYSQLYFSSAAAAFTDPGPLAAGTSYYYRIRSANGDDVYSFYANASAIVNTGPASLPVAPTGFSGSGGISYLWWTWTDNASNELGYRVLSGTVNISGNLSANTAAWLQTGLSTNTLYGPYFVQAFNSTGTVNSSTAAVYTQADPPTSLNAVMVGASSATLAWPTATNPPGTIWQVIRSTTGNSLWSVVYLSSAAPTFTNTGLNADSTYYYSLGAVNGDGWQVGSSSATATIHTAPTSTPPAGPNGFDVAVYDITSLLWSWNDIASDENGYRVMSGTQNVSGDLPANTATWLQTGLSTNTSYGPYFVEAFNLGGSSASASRSRYTRAVPPLALSAVTVHVTSATLSWLPSTNPPWTTWILDRSTFAPIVGFPHVLVSSGPTSFTMTDLQPSTSYYFEVYANSGDGIATSRSVLGGVITAPAISVPPSGFAGAALDTSKLKWTWNDNGTDEAGYRVMAGTVNASGDLAANTTFWLQTGLSANAPYGPYLVRAFNASGAADSGSASRYTLTDPPNSISVTVNGSSASFTWPTMSNPVGTRWSVERGLDGVNYSQLYFSSAAAAFMDTGLAPGTTYYYRIRSANGDDAYSFYANASAIVRTGGTALRTWVGLGATVNASEAANWSPAVIPAAGDSVLFNGASTKTCTFNLAVPLSNFTLGSGYSGIVYLAADAVIDNIQVSSGLLRAPFNSTITVNSSLRVDGTSSIQWGNGRVRLLGDMVINSPVCCSYDGTGSNVLLEWAGSRFQVFSGTGRAQVPNSEIAASSDVYFNHQSRVEVGSFTITSGRFLLAGLGEMSLKAWKQTGGAFVAGRSNVEFMNYFPAPVPATIQPLPGQPFWNLSAGFGTNGVAHVRALGPLEINGTLTITTGSFDGGGYVHTVGGDWQELGGPSLWSTGTLRFTAGRNALLRLNANTRLGGVTIALACSTCNVTAQTDTTIERDLNVSTGAWSPGAFAHHLRGNILSPLGRMLSGSGTTLLDGTTAQTISNGSNNFYDLVIANPAGVSLPGSTFGLNIQRHLDIKPGAALDLASDDVSVWGDLISSGTLAAAGSTVTLGGAGARSVYANGASFGTLSVANASSATFKSSFTASAFTASQAGGTLLFAAGSTFTVTTLNLGASTPSPRVRLRSTAPGTPWRLNVLGAATALATDAQDSDASGGNPIMAVSTTNVDAGNNRNWIFSLPPSAVQFTTVSSVSLSAQWTLDSPARTPLVALSTDSFATLVSSQVLGAGVGGITYAVTDNTTYFFKVKVAGAPDTSYSAPISVVTPIGAPAAIVFDEISPTSIVASAYAPTPAFSNLDRGLSGINAAIDGTYQGWRSGNQWTLKTAMPTARFYLSAASVGGKLYALGGSNGADLATNEEYDPAANGWISRAPMPSARRSLAAASSGGKIYALGGINGGVLATNEAYDPATNTWMSRVSMPTARDELGASALGGKIYAMGGGGGSPRTTNEEYDPIGNSWASRASVPTARTGLEIPTTGGKVYAIGGGNGPTDLATNEEYDPISSTWATRASMPTARYHFAAASLGGKIYVSGGINTSGILAMTEEYDPATNKWARRAPMPTARYRPAGAAVGGKLYVVGGNTGAVLLATNEEYDPGVSRKFTGLTPNTLYSFKAKARNSVGVETGESIAVSTYTLAAPPNGSALLAITVQSIRFGWSVNGNPAGTEFQAEISTAAAFVPSTPGAWVPDTSSATFAGLSQMTTYYLRARARNAVGITTPYDVILATRTPRELAPTGFAGTALGAGAIRWSWSDNSTNELGFRVLSGTISLSGDLPAGSTSWTQLGLSPNTLYGPYVVRAFTSGDDLDSAPASRRTLAAAPSTLGVVAVSSSAISLAWTDGGNPAGTRYELQRSTGGSMIPLATTTANAYTDAGLMPVTLYSYQLRAVNDDGVYTPSGPSTAAATSAESAAAPPSAFSGAPLSTTRIAWTWSDNSGGELGYRVMSGAANVSGNLPPNTTTWVQGGLSTNTVYGPYRVQSFNGGGVSESASASAGTLSAVPAEFYPRMISSASITLGWTPNGNPPGTRYSLAYSTAPGSFAFGPASSVTARTLDGLAPATTYYFAVVSLSSAGTPSAAANTAARSSDLSAPPAASGFSGSATGPASLLWTWTDNAADELGFRVLSGTTSVSGNLPPDTTSWAQAGLQPNTLYGPYLVRTFNAGGTADSGLAARFTLAAAPAGLAAGAASSATVTLSWSASGNPAGTRYRLERSTGGVFVMLAETDITSFADGGLTPSATFAYRVQALNAEGVATAYSAAVQTTAAPPGAPAAPTGLGAVAVSRSAIRWNWTLNSSNGAGVRLLNGGTNVSGDLPAGTNVWLQSGLSTNTLSGPLVAQVFNSGGAAVSTAPVSRYTLAAPPNSLTVAASSSTIALNWSAATNPAGTIYELHRSTGGDFSLRAAPATTTFTDSGLTPLTAYVYEVRALNGDGVATAFSRTASANTLAPQRPAAPTGFSGAALSVSGIRWIWSDNADNETGYRVLGAAGNVSGDLPPGATTWTQMGLTPNAAAGPLRAQAFNAGGTEESASGSRFTLAAAPEDLNAASVSSAAATLAWSAAGNPSGTVFEVQRASGAIWLSLATQAGSAFSDGGLASGATYLYRVRALNGDGFASAFSASLGLRTNDPSAPLPATGFAGRALDESRIEWSWTDGASNENGYRVLSGTTSLSGDLAANTSAWVQTGLAAGAEYGPYLVQAFNAGGGANSGTAFRATIPAAPAALTVTGISSVTVSLSWGFNGNPPGTQFELERSAGSGFSLAWTGTSLAATDSGLSPATAYNYRVRAVNGDGAAGGYGAAASTTTLIAAPAAPAGLAADARSVSELRWTWTPTAGASAYRLYYATSPATLLAETLEASFAETGLDPNTPQRLSVAALNSTGEGARSATAAAYTLAAAPANLVVSEVQATSATFAWSLGANPAGTRSEVEVSTDGAYFRRVFLGADNTFTVFSLSICRPTIVRVRALNGDGLASDYAPSAGFTTRAQSPLPVAGLNAASLTGNRIDFRWTPSPSEGITGYRLYFDAGSGNIDYVVPLASFSADASSYVSDVLISSPAYRFGLRTVNRCGVEEANTDVLATAASLNSLTGVRAAIKVPDSGKKISGNRVTIVAEIILGDDAQTRQVLFQYKPSSAAIWADIIAANVNHPNPDFNRPWLVHLNVTSLEPGPYDLRAVATDFAGNADATPPAITVTVDRVAPDIEESSLGGGNVQKQQKVNNGGENKVQAADEGSAQISEVTIPAGALNSSTATITVVNNPLDVPPVSRKAAKALAEDDGVEPANAYLELTLSNGQSRFENGKTAALSVSYADADDNGIVDGTTLRAADLQLFTYDPTTEQWRKDFASVVDTAKHRVTGNTPHFTLFGIFAAPPGPAALSNFRIYPVPFKPNGGNPDEGRGYNPGDPNSGIIFENLPTGAVVTIYTVSGRRVKRLDAPASGRIQWDARNEDGRDVATGGYVAVVTSAGQQTVSRVIAIIR